MYGIGKWTTADGDTAVVLCDDAPGDCPLIGYVVTMWRHDGRIHRSAEPCAWDENGNPYTDSRRDFRLVGPEGFEPETADPESIACRNEYAARQLAMAGRGV